jgi:hypothetical protein
MAAPQGLAPNYERLHDYIAKRMRMSHFYQSPRRTWAAGSWGRT